MEESKKELLKKIFLFTSFFWIVAHGFRFTNNLHTGDTLVSIFQDDIMWQRSLGRFMQPLTMIFRGTIASPWLIFVISVCFFSLALFLISEIINVKDTLGIFIICGVLSCNPTITCANAAYTPWMDVYSVALLLASFGVWLFLKDRWWGYLLGIIAFIGCMGFYQAYICVAFALLYIVFYRMLSEKKVNSDYYIKLAKSVVGLLASGIGYWIAYKLVLKIHNVQEAVNYNSLSHVFDFGRSTLGALIFGTYDRFFHFLTNQGKFVSTILLGINMSSVWQIVIKASISVVLAVIFVGTIIRSKKNKVSPMQWILQILALIVLPPVFNFVFILSKGLEYELSTFSF